MMDHASARELIREGARRALHREPTEGEVEAAQAVALSETGYGSRWSGAGVGSNNWGAILASSPGEDQFSYRDENESGPYVAGFRRYPSDAEGAAAVAREVLASRWRPGVVAAIATGSIPAFSHALFGYYRGRQGQSQESREAEHVRSMDGAIGAMEAAGLGRTLRVGPPGPREVPRMFPRPSAPFVPSSSGGGLAAVAGAALLYYWAASSSSRRPSRA
jgi:hypothetical protein